MLIKQKTNLDYYKKNEKITRLMVKMAACLKRTNVILIVVEVLRRYALLVSSVCRFDASHLTDVYIPL